MAGIAGIFADWGTTNRRAWAIDRAGAVLERRRDHQGLLGVKDRAFEASFRGFVGDWLETAEAGAPVVMGGMVGSKLGWREAPYLETPVAFADLARNLTSLPDLDGHPLRIVPGLASRAPGRTDVMRGEECQLYGLWLGDRDDRFCVLPGTHSKWAEICGKGVAAFRTYMTGEVFGQLTSSGTIAQLMRRDAPHDPAAFQRGIESSEGVSAGGLLNRLFGIRAQGLFAEIQPEAVASHLSGLLIGAEVRDALSMARDRRVEVIGSPNMIKLYVEALGVLGVEAEAVEGDRLFRTALLAIAQAAGLM